MDDWHGLVRLIFMGGWIEFGRTILCITVGTCIRVLACKHVVWDVGLICNDMCYVQLSIYSTIYYTCWLAVMHELHSNIMGGLILGLFYEVMQHKNTESSLS